MQIYGDIRIKIENLLSQVFGGASVTSGEHNGVQKLIKDHLSKPVPFVHCAVHNLNLAVNDAVNSVTECSSINSFNQFSHFLLVT